MRIRIPDAVAAGVPVLLFVVLVTGGVILVSRLSSGPAAISPAAEPSGAAVNGPATTPVATPSAPPTPSASGTPSPRPTQSPTRPGEICIPRTQDAELSVITFNIHSARGRGNTVGLSAIGDALAGWRPDVVLLQEVDRGRIWTGRVDMPATLADRLGMFVAFGVNKTRSPTNQYGTVILSRYPILSSSNQWLPGPPGTHQRSLQHAVIDVDGIEMSVYGTHLEHTSSAARQTQMNVIAPILRDDPRPKVFGGDLNTTPGSATMRTARSVVTDTWTSVGVGAGHTAPAADPRIRIDYLMYGDAATVDVTPTSAEVLPPVVSDHRPVRATYQVIETSGEVCVPDLQEQDLPSV